jgi:phosphoglycerol transferase MdoB-like AlkP superfamily enzyme
VALWVRRASAPLFTIALSAKLIWFHILLPEDYGQRGLFRYLAGAWQGLVHEHSLKPLFFSLYWATVGSVLVVVGLSAFLRPRQRFWALFGYDVFVSVLTWGDLVYHRYFHDLLSLPVLWQVYELQAIGSSVRALTSARDLTLFLDLPLFVALGLWCFRRPIAGRRLSTRLWRSAAYVVAGALIFAAPVSYHWKDVRPLVRAPWWSIPLYNQIGWIAFHTRSVERTVAQWLSKSGPTAKEAQKARAWWHERRQDADLPSPLFGKAKGMNLIVIQVEAFQDFTLGHTFDGKPMTPNLDAFAKDALFFPNYFHQTGDGRTSDGEFITQCSMLGLKQGSVYVRFPGNDFPCLPGALKAKGYSTLAAHAFEPSFWNRHLVYPRMGFDTFVSQLQFKPGQRVGWGLSDADVFRQVISRAKAMPKPFYAFVVTLSSHHPYNLKARFRTLPKLPYDQKIFRDYIQANHFVDGAVGTLVQTLKDEGLWDNTVVAIYGDHDNGVDDRPDYEKFLGHPLRDVDYLQLRRRVGLMIHVPKSGLEGVYPRPAGQQDLAPSLLHLLGYSTQGTFPFGSDLLSTAPHLVPFSDTSFVDGDLFFRSGANGRGLCLDRHTGEKLPTDRCRPLASEALSRIDRSRTMILGNWMHVLLKPEKQAAQARQ